MQAGLRNQKFNYQGLRGSNFAEMVVFTELINWGELLGK